MLRYRNKAETSLPLNTVAAGELGGARLRRAMSLVNVSWIFGSVWATAIGGAPFSLFARDLGASEFQIGLLAALPFLASLVSMPASLLTERTGARKGLFLWSTYLQRALWIPIAILPLWLLKTHGTGSGSAAVFVFMALILLMYCTGAVGGPAWLSWMADIIPDRVRGKYFSRRRQWGILSAIPTALAVGWLIDHYGAHGGTHQPGGTLRWCAIIFICSAVFGIIDIFLFRYVPNVPMEPRHSEPVFALMGGPLRDRQFLWVAAFVATLTFAVSFMGQFVTFYLIDKIGVTGTGIQLMLLVAPMLAQLIVLPIWGHAADRMGKKPVLAIASLGLVPVGLGWCFMGPGSQWLGYVLSVAGGALDRRGSSQPEFRPRIQRLRKRQRRRQRLRRRQQRHHQHRRLPGRPGIRHHRQVPERLALEPRDPRHRQRRLLRSPLRPERRAPPTRGGGFPPTPNRAQSPRHSANSPLHHREHLQQPLQRDPDAFTFVQNTADQSVHRQNSPDATRARAAQGGMTARGLIQFSKNAFQRKSEREKNVGHYGTFNPFFPRRSSRVAG